MPPLSKLENSAAIVVLPQRLQLGQGGGSTLAIDLNDGQIFLPMGSGVNKKPKKLKLSARDF